MRHTFFVLLAVVLSVVPAAGQRQAPETYKLLGISVEGNLPGSGTESDAIISRSGLRVGDEITLPGDQIQKAIQRLWALRIFDDVQFLTERKVENGIYLLIKVHEYPRLERVEVEGADDVGEDDVMKKVTLVRGQIVTPNETKTIVRNIKHLYEEEGHLLAEITVDAKSADTATNRVVVKFVIDEGPGVEIDRVGFAGNTAFSADDLRGEFSDTQEKTWWHFWSHPKFERDKFEKDKKKLTEFYRKNGYLDAEVVSDSTWYSADRRHISVLVNVHEGAQYKIRNITWEGNIVYPAAVLSERLGIAKGEIFNEEKFEQNLRGNPDQTDVASLYLDNGYLKFNLDPDLRRIGADSVDIIIQVYERNQFRIRHIDIVGNTKTQDNVIRRELFTRPGDFFNRSAIIRSLRQLQQLNYFNPEKLRPEPKLVDEENVDIVYTVEEKSSDNVNASVGYSGAFGVTGSLGFTINNFSLAEPLSGGGGQVLNFDWQFGEGSRFRTFSLSFTEPWLYNTPTTLGVSLYDTRQVFVYDLQQTGLSVRVGRGRLTWPDNYFRIDWTFRFQLNNIIDNGNNFLYQVGKTTQYSVTQTISRNSTDNPIFPSTGSNLSLSTEISGGILPGNVRYQKWIFNSDWYTPLFATNRLVFSASTIFGYLNGFTDEPNIPPIEYFYMGGVPIGYGYATPLRGYEDRSVGPVLSSGGEAGGNVVAKQTLELRLAITLNPIPIYVLGFAEAGNVYKDFSHTDFFDMKRSFGFGARLMIQPIGLIGFDYGYGADDVLPRDGQPDGWHFHFQFGRGF